MTAIEVDTRKKNGGEKDKEYSIKCVQNVCTIEYKGKTKDRTLLEFVPLIGTFGENAVKITEWLSFIIGSVGIAIVIYDFETGSVKKSDIGFDSLVITLFCFHFLFYGMTLPRYSRYVKLTKCRLCHRNYAYKEIKDPDIREVSTEDSYIVKITRYWKCKYCGNIDSTESSEDIRTCKEKKEKPKEINCENCGKTGIWPEYRSPDEKYHELRATRIRYYKCEYCGYINITVENGYSSEYGYLWSKGSDPRL